MWVGFNYIPRTQQHRKGYIQYLTPDAVRPVSPLCDFFMAVWIWCHMVYGT